MTDIVEQLHQHAEQVLRDTAEIVRLRAEVLEQRVEIERLRAVVGWVNSWVSNPVGSYSVSALDGLFSMTRDKIADLGVE